MPLLHHEHKTHHHHHEKKHGMVCCREVLTSSGNACTNVRVCAAQRSPVHMWASGVCMLGCRQRRVLSDDQSEFPTKFNLGC